MTKEDNQPFDSVYWRLINFFEKKSEETKTEEEETKTEEEKTKTEEEETKTEEEKTKTVEEETKTDEEETKTDEESKSEFGFCEDNTTKKLNQEGTNCKEYLYKGLIGLFQKKTD